MLSTKLRNQMTTTTNLVPGVRKAAWNQVGTAVTASSASEVASQAGLDWSVSLHDVEANYVIPGSDTVNRLAIPNKKAVIKTTPFGETTAIGVVGNKYKPFQNAEIFSALDSMIDSGQARYAAAGEYDGGAKVWMLLELPLEVTVANDPHAAFLLAKTSHDGSGSVSIKPVIERLFCMNQINKIYRNNNKHTYTLRHTQNAVLSVSDISNIIQLTYDMANEYETVAEALINKKIDHARAVNYFKKVWALPTKVEEAPLDMLSPSEKNARTKAFNARAKALSIYNDSATQFNIKGTEFGLWQAVVEYADHHSISKNRAVATIAQRNDGIKVRALELLGM